MTSVVVSVEAEADLRDLSSRIADAAGEQVAATYLARIADVIEKLAKIPLAAGRPVPQLGSGLRCHPFGTYNVYLRYDEVADIL